MNRRTASRIANVVSARALAVVVVAVAALVASPVSNAAVTDPDTSFGTHPSAATTWFANDFLSFGGGPDLSIARQSSGKLIVGGSLTPTASSGPADQLRRLGSDGMPDNSFGVGGVVGPPSDNSISFSQYTLDKVIVLADGTIETVGTGTPTGLSQTDVAFAHYSADGTTLDTLVTLAGYGGAFDIAEQPNGGIVAVSGGDLFRLNSSHQLDTNFGTGGVASYGWSFTSIAVQSTNQIIAGGTIDGSNGTQGVVGFDGATGAVNNAFGGGPYPGQTALTFGVSGNIQTAITGVRIVPGGGDKIAVAGTTYLPGFTSTTVDFALLSSTGHLDTTFNTTGYTRVPSPTLGSPGKSDFQLSSTGNMIFAGSIQDGGFVTPLLVGVTSAGATDTAISATGTYRPTGVQGSYIALLAQPDGKYVLGGAQVDADGRSNSFVERLVGDDTTYTPPALTQMTFNIVDTRGTPQWSYYIDLRQGAAAPTAADWPIASVTPASTPGTATIPVLANDTVYFNRTPHPTPTGEPEGIAGLAVPVTSLSGPITATLPDAREPFAPGPLDANGLTSAEEYILGQLNDQRSMHGASRLKVSTELNLAASVQARNEALGLGFPDPWFNVINQDNGWPGDPRADLFGIADAPFTDATRVLTHWNGSPSDPESPGIWSALGRAGFGLVGIGQGHGAWIIEVAPGCPTGSSSCGATTDTGDSNAWTPASITITTPAAGAIYTKGQTPAAAAFTCTPGTGWGQSTCTAPALDVTLGSKTFTVTATDADGDTTSKTVAYTVKAATGGGGSTGGGGGSTGGGGGSTGGGGGSSGGASCCVSATALAALESSFIKALVHDLGGKFGPLTKPLGISAVKGESASVKVSGRPHAGAKPVVIAAGSKAFTSTGNATILLKLTARGRKLLKHAHKLTVTINVRLSDAKGHHATSHSRATLKRG
jgi:Domain of unknown function (DUF5122) beta-propeller